LLHVGNDLVDLADPESQPERPHRRFDQRVFTPVERNEIARDMDSNRARWTYWALKEAAYKAVKKCDSRVRFSPIQYACDAAVRSSATVHFQNHLLRAAVIESAQWVCTVALLITRVPEDGTIDPSVRIEAVTEDEYRLQFAGNNQPIVYAAVQPLQGIAMDPSVQVRQLGKRIIGKVTGIDPHHITYVKRGRMPELRVNGGQFSGDISLSHHGHFVAFSCAFPAPE